MSSSWILKTRQMSEAGKEILLREALATHIRSLRDRQSIGEILLEKKPIEELFSLYSAFYLYHYQGVRLLRIEDTQDLPIEEKTRLEQEEKQLLESEIKKLLGPRLQEDIHLAIVLSEFIVAFCDEIGLGDPYDPEVLQKTKNLIKNHLTKVPKEFNPNFDIDLINEISGWAPAWRKELYAKASGLKESALSLREELLRPHDEEVVETTILKHGLKEIYGQTGYAQGRILDSGMSEENLDKIATTVARYLLLDPSILPVMRKAHNLKVELLKNIAELFRSPITITKYENDLSRKLAKRVGELAASSPDDVHRVISFIIGIDPEDIRSSLRVKGFQNVSDLARNLETYASKVDDMEITDEGETEDQKITKEELERIERSLKTLDKLEKTLEKPVKGMLKARGLRESELQKINVELLAKDRNSLIGIENQVLEELRKKLRVPPPAEIKRLLELRERVEKGALKSVGVASAADITQQRVQKETVRALALDLVWHFTINYLLNLTRVVETYIRSKQDLLRVKAILKSIYEGTESELRFLREEILIDLMAERIYEMKCLHPSLDAPTVCAWMHARLSYKDMTAARTDLKETPSPVFEGLAEVPLVLEKIDFDNYAIAFDVMHRFLEQQRKEKVAREELLIEAEREEQRMLESKKKTLDVLAWLATKSQTVFRAIGRVGTKGLEWTPADGTKLANLLSYYIGMNRGKRVCGICGLSPSSGNCPDHGRGNMISGNDMDNLTIFVKRAISDIKSGLLGSTAEAMTVQEARTIVNREITVLKRNGKITSKTNLNALLPGEINYIIGPALAQVIGKYFNESLDYAARRAGFA